MSLVLTLSDVPIFRQAAEAAPASHACPKSLPDRYSAMLAARWCGGRVEISGELTETTQVWAEKDGTLTADQAAGIARFKRDGNWVEVDLTLQKGKDGSVAPKAHPYGLSLAGAQPNGSHTLVALRTGSEQTTLGWRGALPDPQINGTTAVYRDVAPGVDLVVEVLRTGYEQSLVVKDRAGLSSVPALLQGLSMSGPNAEADGRGGVFFKDDNGKVAGRTGTPYMWDAATDPLAPGEHPNNKKLGLSVKKLKGKAGEVAISADAAWLADPARQFPITIDPGTFVQETYFDTYVASNTSSDLSGSTKIAIGTQNSGATKRIGYVNFDASAYHGAVINWATFKLWGTLSAGGCTVGTWQVWRTSGAADTSTTWNYRPSLDQFGGNSLTESQCTGTWQEADATSIFQYQASNNGGAFSIAMVPYWDNTNSYYKEFKSSETLTMPHLTLNWNDPPTVASPYTTPAAACATGANRPYMVSKTPTLNATISDSDSTPSNVTFEWWVLGGSKIGEATKSNVPSGTIASATVPDGAFAEAGTYMWRVQASDPSGLTSVWTTCEFTIDTIKPGAPIVTSKDGVYPSITTNNTWGHGGYGTAGTFTLTPGVPSSDLASLVYQLDTQATSTTVNATAAIDISVTPTEDGVRTLTVWGKDRAGNQSEPTKYIFNVGRAGLTEPRPNAEVIKRTNLTVVGDATYTRVRYQFRRGPGAPEQDIPWPNLTNASGGAISGTAGQPVALSTIGAKAVWNAIDTLGPVGGVAQVRARLYSNSGFVADLSIRNPVSGRCLDLDSYGQSNGTLVQIYDCTNAFNQKFELQPNGTIVNSSSGRCLDASWGGTGNGTAIWLWDCHGGANQVFQRQANGSILNPVSGRCLDLTGYGTANGTKLQLWDCLGGANQVFTDIEAAYNTQWITITADPNGNNAATADVGPGSANLLTGAFSTSVGDVNQFGMAVGRTYNSRNPLGGLTPLGERLTDNQKQISTDTTGFGAGWTTLTRVTDRGQGGSPSALQMVAAASGNASGDTFADMGGDWGALRLGMVAGKRYRATAWIYVPAATGLTPTYASRGERIVVFVKNGGAYVEIPSSAASFVDGWQQLSVDFTVPAGATEAFIRIYNGFATGTGKVVYWDNLSVKELSAPFGPQWSGGVVDSTASAYTTLEFPSNDLAKVNTVSGTPLTFGRSNNNIFFPQPEAEGMTLTYVDSTHYQLSDQDGNVVEFLGQGTPTAFTVNKSWTTTTDTTNYAYDLTNGRARVTRVMSPVDAAITGCANTTPAKGCRTLDYDYATSTTATASVFGDVVDQIRAVKLWAWNPATSAMESVEVAHYNYDDQGRLREVWDPRISPALKTSYAYDGNGILSMITPPGQLPWQLNYTTIPGDSGLGRLANVSRAALPSGTAVTTVVYGVPLSGSGAPYNLSAAEVARWEPNPQAPTDATAIFPATQVPNGNQSTGVMPSNWDRATVTYLDGNARVVNTAAPGGYISTTLYDQWSNTIFQLTAGNRLRALNNYGSYGASSSTQAAGWLATAPQYSPDGKRKLREWTPDHWVQLGDGTYRMIAGSTSFTYDEGAPATGKTYDLVTTELSNVYWWDGTGEHTADARTIKTEYDWTLEQQTKSIVDPAGFNLATRTGYDSSGRTVLETNPAGGSSDTTPSTRLTVYYTNAANGSYPQCGNRPEWAGLVCLTKPGGQPGTGPELPTATTTYDRYGNPAVITESTSAGTLRTITVTYDSAGRSSLVAMSAPGLGQALETRRTLYDSATGLLAKSQTLDAGSNVTAEIVRVYDTLGRPTSYKDADNNTSTFTYDIANRPLVINDGKATRTYTYDGGTERRGVATSVVDSNVGLFTATYDADGNIVGQTWPNGVNVSTTFDEVGEPISLTYTQPGCGQADCTLYAETDRYSAHGQVAKRTSSLSAQVFGYDAAGRLASVADTVSNQCTTRVYSYDTATNRQGVTTYNPSPGTGACQTTTSAGAIAWSYDAADRATSSGYSYDALGRTLTMPGQDTAIASGGTETLTYHVNDMVRSLTQGSRTAVYTLDVLANRIRSWTDNATGTTVTKTNHFLVDNDNPMWTDEGSGGAYTRAIGGVNGIAAVHTPTTGELYVLTNLHGDFIAGMAETGYGLAYTNEQTENGQPRNVASAGTRRYGWLGSSQRASDNPGGLMLMGARVYAPGSGRFLSVDSVYGGNANAYEYCTGDGVNCTDTNGQWSVWGISCRKTRDKRTWWNHKRDIDYRCSATDNAMYWLSVFGIIIGGIVTIIGLFTAELGVGIAIGVAGVLIAVFSALADKWYGRYCQPKGAWINIHSTMWYTSGSWRIPIATWVNDFNCNVRK